MSAAATASTPPPDLRAALTAARCRSGPTLMERTRQGPVLLVLLRHLGCTFCKEALADIAAKRGAIERRGATIVLAHMTPPERFEASLAGYGLAGIDHVSDPERHLYAALQLPRGTLGQLFGLKCLYRGMLATLRGHIVGPLAGDGFQMPGAFLLLDGRIIHAYRHATAADRPDYEGLCAV